jgi:hypothetical protein
MTRWVHEDGDERCFECYAIEWEASKEYSTITSWGDVIGHHHLVHRHLREVGPREGPPKPCNTPTPDPASPCGWTAWAWGTDTCATVGQSDRVHTHDAYCSNDEPGSGSPDECTRDFAYCHPHQPTRCTCGHPIERRA